MQSIVSMDSINIVEDIKPLSEFRANTATLVKHIKKTGRPLVLTQHGKSAVVLLDVGHYQSMVSSIEQFSTMVKNLSPNIYKP